jgi:hypothetical protein
LSIVYDYGALAMRANQELMAEPVGMLAANFGTRNRMNQEVPLRLKRDLRADIPDGERAPHILERR